MTFTTETFRQAVNGDKRAIEKTIRQFTPLVYRMVNRYSGLVSGHMRDDLLQEGKLGIVQGIRTFDLNRNVQPMTWLFTKVRAAVEGAARKEVKHPKYMESFEQSNISIPVEDPDNLTFSIPDNVFNLREFLLKRYKSDKSSHYKIICYKYGLFGYPELKQCEIAERLGESKQVVSGCISRFKTALKKELSQFEDIVRG